MEVKYLLCLRVDMKTKVTCGHSECPSPRGRSVWPHVSRCCHQLGSAQSRSEAPARVKQNCGAQSIGPVMQEGPHEKDSYKYVNPWYPGPFCHLCENFLRGELEKFILLWAENPRGQSVGLDLPKERPGFSTPRPGAPLSFWVSARGFSGEGQVVSAQGAKEASPFQGCLLTGRLS